jgi:hypothetical protein
VIRREVITLLGGVLAEREWKSRLAARQAAPAPALQVIDAVTFNSSGTIRVQC